METMNKYKEIIPFAALVLYAFGGIYYFVYYFHFGIDIVAYFSLTEALLLSIEFLLINLLIIFIIELFLGVLVEFVYPKILSIIPQKYRREKPASYLEVSFGIQFFLLVFVYIPLLLFSVNCYSWLWLPAFSLLLFFKMYLLFKNEDKEIKQSLLKLFCAASIIICSLTILYYAYKDANSVLQGKSSKQIEIIMETKTYLTNDKNIFFIGETNSTYFLYDKEKNNTIIIDKSHVIESILHNQAMNKENIDKYNLFPKK